MGPSVVRVETSSFQRMNAKARGLRQFGKKRTSHMGLNTYGKILLVFVALIAGACDDADDANKPKCAPEGGCSMGLDASVTNDSGVPPSGPSSLVGRVFDADSARSLAKAKVTADASSATSDAKGRFELMSAAALGMLEISRATYASTHKSAPSGGGYIEAFIKRVDKSVSFRGDQGVNVELESGERLEIPANAVIDEKGKGVPGLVTLEVAAIDGYKRSHAAALPGDGRAERKDKATGRIGVESGLEIRILDGDKKELNVDAKKDVVADLPARGKGESKELAVYSYDEDKERWVEEGVAPSKTVEGKRRYRADIDHLSWWGIGKFWKSLGCVSACVEDGEGKAVAGAQVWVVGASVAGVSSFFTDSDGCGKSEAVADADFVLVAQADGQVSAPKNAQASATAQACTDAGTLTLGEPSSADCASGFARCGDVCVDSATLDIEACVQGDGGPIVTPGDGGPSGSATIEGVVVDNYQNPVSGIDVTVDGQTVKSASDGSFTVSGVQIPYTIVLASSDTSTAYGFDERIAFVGVTRTDPKIFRAGGSTGYSASLGGELVGGVFPVPPNHRTDISCQGPTNSTFSGIQNPGNSGPWGPYNQAWSGGPSFSCTLFALQYNSSPFGYTGMGSKVVTLEGGMSYGSPAMDFALAAVTTHDLTGDITVPVGTTINYVVLSIGTFSRVVTPTGSSYSVSVPDNVPPTVKMGVRLDGQLNGATVLRNYKLTPETTVQDLVVNDPLTVLSPAADATVGGSQVFEFVQPPGSVVTITFSWTTGDPDVDGTVEHTQVAHFNGSSITLKQLRDAGLDLPAGLDVEWYAQSTAPLASVDAMLASDRDVLAYPESSYTAQRNVAFGP